MGTRCCNCTTNAAVRLVFPSFLEHGDSNLCIMVDQRATNRLQRHELSPVNLLIPQMSAAVMIGALTLCMLGNFSCFCCRLLTFFKMNFFEKILSGTLSECQTFTIQIRTDRKSVLIWVQTVCKGYQQMTKGDASKDLETVKIFIIGFFHGNNTV